MATPIDTPAPLRLPAILQNATNTSQRQVEAHNAQQRERLAARREAKSGAGAGSSSGNGRGKRVVRRIDNAAFIDNPHIVQPRRTDLYPSVPLQPRPSRASFPPSALDRSARIPGTEAPDRNPFSEASVNGAFSTSLKGTRALLRKRGHRAEGLVGRVEGVVRGWLGGHWDGSVVGEEGSGGWRVVDDTPVEIAMITASAEHSDGDEESGVRQNGGSPATHGDRSTPGSRRLPSHHRATGPLPPLPTLPPLSSTGPMRVPAVLELSRSVAHITLAAVDPFDRLVIHLLARYYECLSWSEEHHTTSNQPIRLTHIVVPSIARPRASAAHALPTPETTDVSDLSGPSGSENSSDTSDIDRAGFRSESETETERGTEVDPDETFRPDDIDSDLGEEVRGYHIDAENGNMPPGHREDMADRLRQLDIQAESHYTSIPLLRTNSAGSSMYASSEAESDYSSVGTGHGGLGDSMTFPSLPRIADVGGQQQQQAWTGGRELDEISDVGSVGSVGALPEFKRNGLGMRANGAGAGGVPVRREGGWADKPTFFEYLYGA